MLREKGFFNKHKRKFLIGLILIFGIVLRVVLFPNHPKGLNQDEASIGYDAWSILNYGVDRNGTSFPIHHISWGSGQNALYTYLTIPFVAIFGLNEFSVRIVNLLFSILSILAVYSTTKRLASFKTAAIAMLGISIAPWNIMLSRWGLESNLFPSMFIISVWALVKAFDKKPFIFLAAILFGLTMYSYGSSYVVVPVFVLIAFIYILKNKIIPLKYCLIAAGIFIVVAIPIGLFVIVNLFDLGNIKFGVFTIPQMTGTARITTVTGIAPFKRIFSNIYNNIILQTDFMDRNAFIIYGCFYVISMPFTILGIIQAFKKRDKFSFLTIVTLICSLLLFFIYQDTNINRVNIIYVPLILLTALGISEFVKSKTAAVAMAISYAIMFAGFTTKYFGKDYRNNIGNEFYYSFGDAIVKAEEIADDDDIIYVTDQVNMPYIYVLFYNKPAPDEYYSTVEFHDINVEFHDINAEFQWVTSFGRYVFNINPIVYKSPGTYIIPRSMASAVEDIADEIVDFENYSVVKIN